MNTNYRKNIARAALDQARHTLCKIAFYPDSQMIAEVDGLAKIATREILATRHTDRKFFKDCAAYVAKCFRQFVAACRGVKGVPTWILKNPKEYAQRLDALKINGASDVHPTDVRGLWFVGSFTLATALDIPYKCTKDGGEFVKSATLSAICFSLYY